VQEKKGVVKGKGEEESKRTGKEKIRKR